MESTIEAPPEMVGEEPAPPKVFGRTRAIEYGAKEGPLASLIPVYIDVETLFDPEAGISLKSNTLRQYIKLSHMTSIAIAIGNEDPEVWITPDGKFKPEDEGVLTFLTELANDSRYVFVAHNAAFDIRIIRFMLGVPQPQFVWCTVEGAMAAWPELLGGYSLQNIGEALNIDMDKRKLEIDLKVGKYSEEELKVYNVRDVVALRENYLRQIARISAREQRIALMTHNVRKFHFEVDQSRLDNLIETLDTNARAAESTAKLVKMSADDPDAKYLAEQEIDADGAILVNDHEISEIFNRENDNGKLTSIRTTRLTRIIKEKFGVKLPTTSLKKLSPVFQAKHPKIVELLRQTTRANKMLSHTRRSACLVDVPEIDVELGYARAHTMRFSSPGVGKSLNIHNIPKHDKQIAEPVRKIFKLPKGKCFVRGDLANVEYRVEGWLTDCITVFKMFNEKLGGSRFVDPYIKTWKSMTMIDILKKDPIRQVSKSAVLGLGFCMSAFGYAMVLLRVCSDPTSKITETTLKNMVMDLGWPTPSEQSMGVIIERTGCSKVIAVASWNIHRLFNAAHPEFSMTAEWLVRCVTEVATVGDGKYDKDSRNRFDAAQRILDRMRLTSAAPNPDKLRLVIDDDFNVGRPSIRVHCGPWPATVCWREPAVRVNKLVNEGKPRLTILKANGFDKTFTKQLAIENVTQAAARNALCYGLLRLEAEYGERNVLHVHDEVLLIVDKTREAVLRARQMLIDVFGPASNHPMDWAILIKPEEISITQSLWEEEDDIKHEFDEKKNKWVGNDRWGKIERDEPGMFDDLP